jgi:dihydrofolate reductase
MNQSLDGFVDYTEFGPGPELFRHFIEMTREQSGSLYGRKLYEIMRYWDDTHPEWGEPEREFASAWRAMPKWVISRTLTSVGPNATLIKGDLAKEVGALKQRLDGELDVGGPDLADSLTKLGLVDEYRIYLHPVVLGTGSPFFRSAMAPLRLIGSDQIDEDVIRLRYAPVSAGQQVA